MNLPGETGFYLWYILDLNYMDVGLVQIMQDKQEHLKWLAENPKPTFYVYDVPINRKFTMYHQAHSHLPPADAGGKPIVDGWIPFDFRWVDHYSRQKSKIAECVEFNKWWEKYSQDYPASGTLLPNNPLAMEAIEAAYNARNNV